jgi:uncharacterized protein
MARFYRYELRARKPAEARAFYGEILGPGIWGAELSVVPLPERLATLGVPPHWLGHVGVEDVAAAVARMVALGGQAPGPIHPGAGGALQAVLRDPPGAVFAVSAGAGAPAREPVAWHHHHGEDEARSLALYGELFGWVGTSAPDLVPEQGRQQGFAWEATGPTVGSLASTARPPRVHPQWLYFFAVPDIQEAVARVRARGGGALEISRTAAGALAVPCEDPEGAAFGLYQAVPS